MPKPIYPPQNSLFDQNKENKVIDFLKTVPYLSFSETGLSNIARRFGISVDYLRHCIAEHEARLKEGGRSD